MRMGMSAHPSGATVPASRPRSRGVPIDGIGVEMHIFDLHFDFEGLAANIRRFGIWLPNPSHGDGCERPDWSGWDGAMLKAEDATKQAEIYRRIAHIGFSPPKSTGAAVVGFSDR